MVRVGWVGFHEENRGARQLAAHACRIEAGLLTLPLPLTLVLPLALTQTVALGPSHTLPSTLAPTLTRTCRTRAGSLAYSETESVRERAVEASVTPRKTHTNWKRKSRPKASRDCSPGQGQG